MQGEVMTSIRYPLALEMDLFDKRSEARGNIYMSYGSPSVLILRIDDIILKFREGKFTQARDRERHLGRLNPRARPYVPSAF